MNEKTIRAQVNLVCKKMGSLKRSNKASWVCIMIRSCADWLMNEDQILKNPFVEVRKSLKLSNRVSHIVLFVSMCYWYVLNGGVLQNNVKEFCRTLVQKTRFEHLELRDVLLE